MMLRYAKHWLWFMGESYSYMAGHNKLSVTLRGIPKAFKFAWKMCKWDKLTPEQKEIWYLSGEGRTIEF